MFRILCDQSSRSTELCLTGITRSDSQYFVMCLVGVWQRNFEPVVCVYTVRPAGNYCRSVIICEIIVNLLVTVQNNRRCTVQRININHVDMSQRICTKPAQAFVMKIHIPFT